MILTNVTLAKAKDNLQDLISIKQEKKENRSRIRALALVLSLMWFFVHCFTEGIFYIKYILHYLGWKFRKVNEKPQQWRMLSQAAHNYLPVVIAVPFKQAGLENDNWLKW